MVRRVEVEIVLRGAAADHLVARLLEVACDHRHELAIRDSRGIDRDARRRGARLDPDGVDASAQHTAERDEGGEQQAFHGAIMPQTMQEWQVDLVSVATKKTASPLRMAPVRV